MRPAGKALEGGSSQPGGTEVAFRPPGHAPSSSRTDGAVAAAAFSQAPVRSSFAVRTQADLADIRSSIALPLDFRPLGRPDIQMTSRAVQVAGFQMWSSRTSTGFTVVPTQALDVYTLCLPERGSLVRHWERGETEVGVGAMSLLHLPQLRQVDIAPGFDAVGVTIDARQMIAQIERLEGPSDEVRPAFVPVMQIDTLPMKALARTVRILYARLHLRSVSSDLALPLLQELLLNQILAAWTRDAPLSTAAAPEDPAAVQMRRALDFIHAHVAEPITVAEIAAAAGTSVRSLQIAFRRERQLSPIAYILGLRLDRARHDLQQAGRGLSVSQIAYQWGFLHMSDFSRRYRARFGCTPSETRRGS